MCLMWPLRNLQLHMWLAYYYISIRRCAARGILARICRKLALMHFHSIPSVLYSITFNFYVCSKSLNTLSLFCVQTHVKNSEVPEISPYLQVNKLTCYWFMNTGRSHGTSGPETEGFITHSVRSTMDISIFALFLLPPSLT